MATNKGVIQGYTGVAAVDARRQIIVDAQAHGTGSEQELLGPVVQAMQAMQATPSSVYRAEDFTYDAAARTCVCPAGQSLYRKGRALVINGFVAEEFRGTKGACGPCARRPRDPCDPDACADRYAGRARAVRAALRDGGAGVWERALQQGARPLHVARTDQGRWAVEAQLPGAQHRKARPGAGAHPRQGARHHALPRRVRQPPARQAAARLAPIEVDPLACPSCQSPMRIVACITQESDPTLRARRRGAHEPGDAAMTAPP